ncbi:E3 ubiquitin-protein ligase SINA-like 10 [Argentina anserina]|uniref:E3 ubiquitin-protein ligase SINA-like 10 n=1 Tax=Argentina anserina TaxID=57926 RepID=UPI00217658DC|nr:E3 ubiquitin-protein ligase SINA-like 10 [Potentilla anserina]
MTRFSLGGDEDGEGPSSPRHKRRRLVLRPAASITIGERRRGGLPAVGDESASSESEEEEEQSESEEEEEEDENDDETDGGEEQPPRRTTLELGSASATLQTALASTTTTAITTDRSISITLADPDVLDCPICCESLTVPVFQCENGHIACCSCSTKIKNKCPSCSWPIGYSRCRAIEKVLESVRMSCQNIKYGCKEWMTCSSKNEHEKACVHSPCQCPHSGCNFVSSMKQLYQHFSSNHLNSAIRFLYNSSFSLTVNFSDKFLVLQEQNDGTLFVLDNQKEVVGNMMRLSCMQPRFMGGFFYDLTAKRKGCLLRLQSFTNSTPLHYRIPTSSGSLIIPGDFFSSCGRIKMDICIWRNGQCPPSFQSTNVT